MTTVDDGRPRPLAEVPRGWRVAKAAKVGLGLAVVAASALASRAPHAEACAGFFPRAQPASKPVPSVQVEQVLLIHDREKGLEHFVREITFREGGDAFGFVVPVPSRPTVDPAKSPFARLHRAFPLAAGLQASAQEKPTRSAGPKVAVGDAGGHVVVHEEKQVGSFQTFVLSADDPAALSSWLAKNDFASTPAGDAWTAHYVKLGFTFVAMKHKPPVGAKSEARVTSETVRISFPTPVPYYPYREPERAAQQAALAREPRVLAVWLVTSGEDRVPVALGSQGGKAAWVRPWFEGSGSGPQPMATVKGALGELGKLLPSPRQGSDTLLVQVFEDQKTTRPGMGDVLLVPRGPLTLTDKELEAAKPLLPLLDPSLAPSAPGGKGAP